MIKRIRTTTLEIAYEESGPADGFPVLLMHGFPYDPRCLGCGRAAARRRRLPGHRAVSARLWSDAVPVRRHAALRPAGGARAAICSTSWTRSALAARGAGRLRLGRTRGLRRRRAVAGAGARSGLGQRLQHPGHRGVGESRLRPRRNSGSGTSIISTPSAAAPASTANRRDLGKLLWQLWSPNWTFDDATYARRAASFDNPDFVDVVNPILPSSLRLRARRPGLRRVERRLAAQPSIRVPTIVLHGEGDGVGVASRGDAQRAVLHRPVSAPADPADRPRRAAGSAARICGRAPSVAGNPAMTSRSPDERSDIRGRPIRFEAPILLKRTDPIEALIPDIAPLIRATRNRLTYRTPAGATGPGKR